MYQTAFGRHGDRTRTAESGARTDHARYHCAVRPADHVSDHDDYFSFIFVKRKRFLRLKKPIGKLSIQFKGTEDDLI